MTDNNSQRWTDERLDRLADAVANNRADIQVLIEGQGRLQGVQPELAATQGQLAQTQERITDALESLNANLVELRAGQERQDRILDYLMSRDAS